MASLNVLISPVISEEWGPRKEIAVPVDRSDRNI
jgi:hypothetical protein